MCVWSVLFGFQNLTKNISFILNDVHNRAVSPRVRKSLVVKFRYSTLFENNIFFFLPSKWVHLFQNYSFNEQWTNTVRGIFFFKKSYENLQQNKTYLCNLKEISNPIHANEEFLIYIESISCKFFIHVKVFFCEKKHDDDFT